VILGHKVTRELLEILVLRVSKVRLVLKALRGSLAILVFRV
tara:strand:+ start:674 stop:796 length:123 start_codon:yes stop_codon:yes gene_type:complete